MGDIDLDALLSGGDKPPEEGIEPLSRQELERNLYYGDRWPKATWPSDQTMVDRLSVRVIAVFQDKDPGGFGQALVWMAGQAPSHEITLPSGRKRGWTQVVTVQVDGRPKTGGLMLIPLREVVFS